MRVAGAGSSTDVDGVSTIRRSGIGEIAAVNGGIIEAGVCEINAVSPKSPWNLEPTPFVTKDGVVSSTTTHGGGVEGNGETEGVVAALAVDLAPSACQR